MNFKRRQLFEIWLILFTCTMSIQNTSQSDVIALPQKTDDINSINQSAKYNPSNSSGVRVVAWHFSRVSAPLLFTVILLMVGILKLVFHYAECLSSIVPESCLLILFGIVVGAILHADARPDDVELEPDVFMLYLLPPIVLDSAYSLNDRVVFQNLGPILLYAVVGTVLNCFIIGPALWGLSLIGAMGNMNISLVQCLLFSSFIVAVDPVAVLAIFQEVGVNNKLYFLVFGESLLNDAVTVVLYNMMLAFNSLPEISWRQMLLGVASFFTVSCGAVTIGLAFGIISALVTRITSHVRVVEPLAVIMIAYMSYLFAELFHWSGIISLIVCGIMQAEYSRHNISKKSYVCVKYFIKMLSTTSDTVIFVFLGLELVRTTHQWHTGFVLWALALCLLARLTTVLSLTFLVNYRHKIISLKEQFIMWYGGLRGAVCFALCETINPSFPHKNIFLTTTLVVVFFTVFVQGITIKPFVTCCNIRLAQEKEKSVVLEFNAFVIDHLMAATEALTGQCGDNYWRAQLERLNNQYLRKWLQSNPMTQDQRLLKVYHKMAMKDHQRHIYDATYKEFEIKEEHVLEEVEDPGDIYTIDEETDKVGRKSSLFSIKDEQEGEFAKLRWAMARNALLSTTAHYDRNLTHEDEEDLEAKLREKHLRILQNHHLRSHQNLHRNSSASDVISNRVSNHSSSGDVTNSHVQAHKSFSDVTDQRLHTSQHQGDRARATFDDITDRRGSYDQENTIAQPKRRLSDFFSKSKQKPKMDMFTVVQMLRKKEEDKKAIVSQATGSEGSSQTSHVTTERQTTTHVNKAFEATNLDDGPFVEIIAMDSSAPGGSDSKHSKSESKSAKDKRKSSSGSKHEATPS